jgi:hypothetical protein
MSPAAQRRRSRLVAFLAAAIAAVAIASMPTKRLVGIDKVVSEETLPLWLKAFNFIDRDFNLDRAAAALLSEVEGDEARAMTALRWTRENVRPQPADLKTRDDHVWYVVIRGYGESDQQADVFTTLLTYAGVPAYWMLIGTPPRELPVSYVKVAGEWRVFDVANGLVFRRSNGSLASPQDIVADPGIVAAAARGAVENMDSYLGYFRGYRPPVAPDVLRADLQMPVRRLVHEARSLIGIEGRVWRIREAVEPLQGARK